MASTWANAAAFFAAKVPKEKVTIPEIGDIWVYGLTSGEKDEYENAVVHFNRGSREMRMSNARATLLILSARNQHGNRLFAEKDMGRLQLIPAAVVDPILDVARRLSGMAAAEMEDLVKNSLTLQEPPPGDCGTESPIASDGPSDKSPTS